MIIIKQLVINNTISFLITGLFLGFIVVYAATVQSTDVEYINNKTVKDAIDELYINQHKVENWIDPDYLNVYRNGDYYRISFKYWNNNYSGEYWAMSYSRIPESFVYDSREELASNYSGFNNAPYYIKSSIIEGSSTTLGHSTCLYYNSHEFCIIPRYGVNLSATEITNKLKNEMILSLKTNNVTCNSDSDSNVTCNVGNYYCKVENRGYDSSCGGSSYYCKINGTYSSADAFCART